MTKSYNTGRNPDADYTIRDMGVPDITPSPQMWKYHTPEWEGMSDEEKDKWLEANQDKLITNQQEKLEDVKLDDPTGYPDSFTSEKEQETNEEL